MICDQCNNTGYVWVEPGKYNECLKGCKSSSKILPIGVAKNIAEKRKRREALDRVTKAAEKLNW